MRSYEIETALFDFQKWTVTIIISHHLTFERVQLLYAIALCIASALYIRRLDFIDAGQTYILDMWYVVGVFVVISISLIEGLAVDWRICFGYGLFLSLVYSAWAIHYTFYDYEEREVEVLGMSFPLLSFIGSACMYIYLFVNHCSADLMTVLLFQYTGRVVSIFLWKQTLMILCMFVDSLLTLY